MIVGLIDLANLNKKPMTCKLGPNPPLFFHALHFASSVPEFHPKVFSKPSVPEMDPLVRKILREGIELVPSNYSVSSINLRNKTFGKILVSVMALSLLSDNWGMGANKSSNKQKQEQYQLNDETFSALRSNIQILLDYVHAQDCNPMQDYFELMFPKNAFEIELSIPKIISQSRSLRDKVMIHGIACSYKAHLADRDRLWVWQFPALTQVMYVLCIRSSVRLVNVKGVAKLDKSKREPDTIYFFGNRWQNFLEFLDEKYENGSKRQGSLLVWKSNFLR